MKKNYNKNIRVGVIGSGYLGKFHVEKYANIPDVDLVGVVDINAETATKVADKYNTNSYTNHLDLLPHVDAVSVVVPTEHHHTICRDCLERDLDVLVEKPMTVSLQEADELIHLADSKNLILQVGHLERFNPAVVALKEFLEVPLFIESHRLSMFQGRGTDVSVVLDLMIHDIDIILTVVKSELKEIRSSGAKVISDHVDIANARLEFANGCVANVTASRISMKNERKIRLFQKSAYLSVDFGNREITVIDQKGEKDNNTPIPGMRINKVCFTESDALQNEIFSFVESVRKRETPVVTGRMGRDALQTAIQVMDQIRTGSLSF